MKDGGGYFLGAKTWVPFAEPHKAFVLYLCWEQARLRGNDVVLHALTDSTAVVEIQSHYFALYDIAGHLKPVIPASEYREIFETIWQDRADKAGWQLKIVHGESYTSTFHFKRAS